MRPDFLGSGSVSNQRVTFFEERKSERIGFKELILYTMLETFYVELDLNLTMNKNETKFTILKILTYFVIIGCRFKKYFLPGQIYLLTPVNNTWLIHADVCCKQYIGLNNITE